MNKEITPLSEKIKNVNISKIEDGFCYKNYYPEEDIKLAVQGALKELRENYWNRKIQKKKEDRTAYWIYDILTKYFGDLAK